MSKLDLNKTEWLELVFENKNKTYGAYQLRQENGKTTAKAFFGGLGLVAGLAALPIVLSSFSKKDIPNSDNGGCVLKLDTTLVVTEVKFREKPITTKTHSEPKETPKTEIPTTVVEASQVKPEKEVPENTTQPSSSGNEGNSTNTGSTTPNTGGNTGPGVIETPKVDIPEGPMIPAVLEKSPMFPGGIDAFLKIVGSRFQAPEAEEGEGTKRIIVMFVVERDGTLSNITVPRSAGKELDEEAIRVLKSIKTKWEPGIYNKQPVRTQYSLPIVVQTN
ncbi:MAG: energy transducer TonB [Limnohabitans sp.]|nr:energy transducer TonB [Limnohabitans sp.]